MVTALGAVPLLLAAGIAVDYSRAATARGDLQEAVDAAVLAGARDGTSNWAAVADATFSASLRTKELTLSAKTFSRDTTGSFTGTASGTVKTTFAGLVAVDTLPISVTAAAAVKTTSDEVCILLLNTSATPGLLLNSGATIDAPNCQVHVKSTANPAATHNASTTPTTEKTCGAGANVIDNGGTHASLTESCTTASDPFAGTLPTPASSTCTYSNVTINGGTHTASPGVYCG